MIINRTLLSKVIHSCLKQISLKRFENGSFVTPLEINQILQENILEMNLDISSEENYDLYLSVLEELQDYIKS